MLKKLISIIITVIYILTMTACGEDQSTNSGNGNTVSEEEKDGENSSEESIVNVSSTEFSTQYRPVSAEEDTFIVKDETTEHYGLVDGKGKEIMPCEFGDMYYLTVNLFSPERYVAVQDKGSYGVYDLSGNEIVAPLYDEIVENTDYTDSFIVGNDDMYGAVDITGKEIMPVQYRAIATSPKGILAGLKGDDKNYTVDLYSASGALQNSFPVELVRTGSVSGSSHYSEYSIRFRNYGSELQIEVLNSRNSYEKICDLNGTAQNYARGLEGSFKTGYFCYMNGNILSVINGKNGEEVVSAELSSESTAITEQSFEKDAGSGNVFGFITVSTLAFENNNLDYSQFKNEYYFVNISENPKITLIDRKFADTSPFYENSAFTELENNAYTPAEDVDYGIYIVNENGERTKFNVPFSHELGHELLENCAVLNNNGYVYVADKEGNTILSEEGYTKYEFTANDGDDGLIALTAPDGSVQIIDSYGNEIVPLGNDYSIAVLSDSEGKESEDYSLIYDRTEDKYIFAENESHHVMETNEKMDSKFAEQLLNGQGWIIWDEPAKTLFAVVPDENGYQVCSAAGIGE